MSTGRRLASLLIVLLLIGAPAAALSFACAGASCDEPVAVTTDVPFCTLPESARSLLEAGYYKGRSPEVFAFAKAPDSVAGDDGGNADGASAVWPNPQSQRGTDVPLVMWGEGVVPGPIEGSPGLEQIAPTLAAIAGFERGNEDVRSGTPIEGVWKPANPTLLVMIAVKGMFGPARGFAEPRGRAIGTATTGSLPIDSTASLTTAGTGGLPDEHGITGSLIRDDEGRLVQAWGTDAPTSVIATLGDDLDDKSGQRALVGMVATAPTDRGLIGGNWYLDADRDDFEVAKPGKVGAAFAKMLLEGGYGTDETTDLIGVTIDATKERVLAAQVMQVEDALSRIEYHDILMEGVPATVMMFGTGGENPLKHQATGEQVVSQVESALGAPVVETAVPGGLFLDRSATTSAEITAGQVMRALDGVTAPGSTDPLFLDAYPGFSVSFSRYCP